VSTNIAARSFNDSCRDPRAWAWRLTTFLNARRRHGFGRIRVTGRIRFFSVLFFFPFVIFLSSSLLLLLNGRSTNCARHTVFPVDLETEQFGQIETRPTGFYAQREIPIVISKSSLIPTPTCPLSESPGTSRSSIRTSSLKIGPFIYAANK